MTDWGRAAIRVDQAHEALGHRAIEAAGAVFISNPTLPDIHVANYVRSVTAGTPEAIERLLERTDTRDASGLPDEVACSFHFWPHRASREFERFHRIWRGTSNSSGIWLPPIGVHCLHVREHQIGISSQFLC